MESALHHKTKGIWSTQFFKSYTMKKELDPIDWKWRRQEWF